MSANHRYTFFRAGGVEQVAITRGDDIDHLDELDKKLWIALACPVRGTEIDERTLALIDTDHDGRIRVPEILAAIAWSKSIFKSRDLFFKEGASLPLAAMDGESEAGKGVAKAARRILADRKKKDAAEITLEDVTSAQSELAAQPLNGDGVVTPDSTEDEGLKKAIEDILATSGSIEDRSGKQGVDKAIVETFFTQAATLLAWETGAEQEGVSSLGDKTGAAASALSAVSEKVRDYFARCHIASFDPRGAAALSATEAELTALSTKTLSSGDDDVGKLPLATIAAGAPLPLGSGLNPAWAARIATFLSDAVTPLVGEKTSLSEADFDAVVAKLSPYQEWLTKKPEGAIGALPAGRVKELVDEGKRAAIEALIDEDAALEEDYGKLESVEKAVRLRRDFLTILKSFVSFADFYARKKATFQAGTLFLDARSCDLCVYVHDPAKHAMLSGLSKAYLAYCDCTRLTGEKTQIVAAFTAGDVDNLMKGRNGVFYDRKGLDWDATITSIIENPLSVRQAFWSPYKKLVRLVDEQVAKRAAEKEKESSASIDKAASAASAADQTKAANAPPEDKKVDVGTVAAIGVAVAGVATFLSSILATFLGLGMWLPVGLAALLLAISGPSMLIAWLKLRQRNLGPILDASGWAINSRVKINVPFGKSLTQVAKLPKGAAHKVGDPFAQKPTPWFLYVLLALVVLCAVLWVWGKLDGYLPEGARSTSILPQPEALAPAPAAPPAAP